MRCLFPLLFLAALPAFAQKPATTPPAQPAAVFRPFGEIAVYPTRDAPAAVVSRNESRIVAEVPAMVQELLAEVGEVVAKGALIARLDARDYELALARARAAEESAKARLALAEAQLKRARELRTEGFISPDALLQRETEVAVVAADLKSAQAAQATARHNLDKCLIRAPFRAIVKARTGQVGEVAGANAPLYTLTDADRLEVAAQVPAQDAASLALAKERSFVGQDGRHPVTLLRISPAIDRAARTREARLAFSGKAPLPGAEGRLVWRETEAQLPAEVLLRRGKELGVFVDEGGKARFVPLPEAQEGRPARAALAPTARVAGLNRHTLSEGQVLAPASAAGGK